MQASNEKLYGRADSPPRPSRDWYEPPPLRIPADLQAAVGGHPIIAQRLARSGILSPPAARRFLFATHYRPAPASELPDMERALARLRLALQRRERILVWGDFDVDGQTATALLVQALQLGGAKVDYHIPNRFREGHGIHLPSLQAKLEQGYQLLLTCDTGISAHDAVELARHHRLDTIITDHHSLPPQLPRATAVINPQRLPAPHALRELPGVGVAYKLIEALYPDEDVSQWLDLVALGIVGDVMVQVDDTRYLLQRGLAQLRANRRPGLRALLQRAQIAPGNLNEGHIGFAIAPRLNALGRLADANPAVDLLTTADEARARSLAQQLEGYNAQRRFLTNLVYESALAQIASKPDLLEYAVLVLHRRDWHSGVIGIVASRLVEEYGKPVVLLATPPDGLARGSARSVAGVDITAALGQVAQHLTSFGGHSMAAGMSLPAASIFDFRRALSRTVRAQAASMPARPALQVDGVLRLDELSLELAEDIARLAPFGNGNPPLTLVSKDLRLVSHRGLGRRGEHLRVELADASGQRQQAIWWRGNSTDLPTSRFDLAYTLRLSSYQNRREALVEWLEARPLAGKAIIDLDDSSSFALQDYRQGAQPEHKLQQLRAQYPDAQIWSEALPLAGAVNRLELQACETLIVWTIPPSADLWAAALATTLPQRLILFSARHDFDKLTSFLARLASLLKYNLRQPAATAALEKLAAALGARERTVQAGLQLLRAMGKLRYTVDASGIYHLQGAQLPPAAELPTLERRLSLLLQETRAYRRYWLKMRIQG